MSMIPRLMAELRARLEEPLSRLDRAIQAARGDDASNALLPQRIRLSSAFRRLATLDDLLRQIENDRALWTLLDAEQLLAHDDFHCHVRVREPAQADVREDLVQRVSESLHTEPPKAA